MTAAGGRSRSEVWTRQPVFWALRLSANVRADGHVTQTHSSPKVYLKDNALHHCLFMGYQGNQSLGRPLESAMKARTTTSRKCSRLREIKLLMEHRVLSDECKSRSLERKRKRRGVMRQWEASSNPSENVRRRGSESSGETKALCSP